MGKAHGCDRNLSFPGRALYSPCQLLHKLQGKENCKMGAQEGPRSSAAITALGKCHNFWLFFLPGAPQTWWAGTHRSLKSLEWGTDRQTHAHRPDKVHFLRQPAYLIKGNIWGYTAPFFSYPIPRDLGAETGACSNGGHPAPSSGPVPLPAHCLQPKMTVGALLGSTPAGSSAPRHPPPSSSVPAKPPMLHPPTVPLNTACTLHRVGAAPSKGDSDIQVLISPSDLVPLYFFCPVRDHTGFPGASQTWG